MIYKKQRAKLLRALVELRRKDRIVALWPERIDAAAGPRYEVLKRHGIPPESFCLWIKGTQEPGADKVAQVEAALKKEGV